MSIPSEYLAGVTEFATAAGNGGALQAGVKWGGSYGSGAVVTFSFPKGGDTYFIPNYFDHEPDRWYPLTEPERDAVRTALKEWASVANIVFTEVDDGGSLVGNLRFAVTDEAGNESAHAYYPGGYDEGGDVWFKNGEWHAKPSTAVKLGSYDYLTVLHEIGHAIGLKHSFEGPNRIDKGYDSYAYTIMSYSATPGSHSNYASFYPTTPMYYDLVAIQGMYGRGVHNAGASKYKFKDSKAYWQTIDDSGGTDTIVHKGTANAVIDLNIGHWSKLGQKIKFDGGSTKWTVAIGPNTTIENATGGSGKDKLIGNGAANLLAGGEGRDKLVGGAGGDHFLFNAKLSAKNADVIKDFVSGEDVVHLARNVVKALDAGVVTAEEFAAHLSYGHGVLEYHGKAIARLKGAPAIDEHDLLVV